jgi:CheY-like chemotaxis protein
MLGSEGAPNEGSSEQRGPETRRLLVVDDEPMIGSLVKSILGGHDVEFFLRPVEALTRATEAPFSAVLCDLLMPEMSGIEFYQALRDKRPELAHNFVLMTGSAVEAEESLATFLASHPVRLLRKPFTVSQLEQSLGVS